MIAVNKTGPIFNADDEILQASCQAENVAQDGQRWRLQAGVRWIYVLIPARMESTRLPGKVMLPDASGVPLIARVAEAAKEFARRAAGAHHVLVAVLASKDDLTLFRGHPSIRECVGVITSDRAESGMARIGEYLATIPRQDHRRGLVVHLQADEPELTADHIERLVDTYREFPSCDVATLCSIANMYDFSDKNTVKVTSGEHGLATRFSRRGTGGRHIGVYAYRPEFALWHAALDPTDHEQTERLEQLRTHDRGARFRVRFVADGPRGVDTQADYEAFLARDAAKEGGER